MSIARTARRIAVSIAWIAGSVFAQDDCTNAVTIIAGLTAGSTIGLVNDTVTGCGTSHDDHWFVYAALCTGTATASVCTPGAATFDTILAAYDGSGGCGNLVGLACNDDFCGTRSEIAFPVVAGGVYYVAVGSAQAFGGVFTMLLTCAAVVPNDECAGAVTIGSGVTAGTNFGATNSTQTGSCNNMGSDVWYRYTAACNGFVEATLCQPGSASFDTILAVFDGSTPCGSLVQIACNDDTCLFRSRVLFPVSSGSSYLLAVGGFSAAQGTFSLAVTCHQSPAEDDCSGAIPLALGTNGPFSNQFATDGQPPPSACPLGFGDVWFTFTFACAGTYRIDTCGGYDTVLSVRDGCAGSSEIACSDDGSAGCAPGSAVDLVAAAGFTYRVRIAGRTSVRGSFNVTIKRVFLIQYSSGLGPGSIGFALSGGVLGGAYLNAITFNAGAFPNGTFFGIDLTYDEVVAEIASGVPFFGVLDACGAFTFPRILAPLLSGQTIYSVALSSDTTLTLPIVSTPPVSYTIP